MIAAAGEECYAYRSIGESWNVWHDGYRFLLCPAAKRWNIAELRQDAHISPYSWYVSAWRFLDPEAARGEIEWCGFPFLLTESDGYRATEHIMGVLNHCGYFGDTPALYGGLWLC